MKATLFLLGLLALAAPARAQSEDQRWQPWLGCWQLTIDDVHDQVAPADLLESRLQPRRVRDNAPFVCVSDAGAGGGRFQTMLGDVVAVDRTVLPDGRPHPIDDNDCTGTQQAEWSKNGTRLFSTVELRCQGESPYRVSGLSLIAANGDWLDVQAVSDGGRESVRVKRYTRRDGAPPVRRATGLTLDEIQEASAKISEGALEAALVETNASYALTGRRVADLADAGVPGAVVDLIVALSYPEKFVIERRQRSGDPTLALRDPLLPHSAATDPIWVEFYYSPYYYEPFGYRLRAYDFGDVIVIDPGYGSAPPTVAKGVGRAVNGQGYTRVGPRVTPVTDATVPSAARVGSTEASTSGRSVSARGDSSSDSSSSSSSSSSSGGSGGGSASSSGGYSSGGSSSSGRTAVPR